MTSTPVVTVAICTYNRHVYLKPVVAAIHRQTLPRDQYCILIVDNSTDTEAASAFHRDNAFGPDVRVVFSSPPGLSRARNVALDACQTRYIAFLDDDALPEPAWLEMLVRGFLQEDHVAVVGGPIAPLWPRERPAWMPSEHDGLLTLVEDAADHLMSADRYAFGANMAYLCEALRGVGGFSAAVGRTGDATLLSCEETHAQDALRAAGYQIAFAAGAKVWHQVQQDRLARGWLRARMAWQSASELMMTPTHFYPRGAMRELKRMAAADADVAAALRALLTPRSGEALGVQLDLVRHLVGVLLSGREIDEGWLDDLTESATALPPPAGDPTPDYRYKL